MMVLPEHIHWFALPPLTAAIHRCCLVTLSTEFHSSEGNNIDPNFFPGFTEKSLLEGFLHPLA